MEAEISGYRQVLVATDFSPHADAALKQAVWLARHTGASITLAHVLPDLGGEDDSFQQELYQAAEMRMRQKVAGMDATELDVTFETFLGEPFAELTLAAQSGDFDLVLSGNRGLAAWEQFFIGSSARRLIRKCASDVWIANIEQASPPKVVLAPTDFSEVSLKAARRGFWVAQQANAQFHLMHVMDSMDVPEDLMSKVPSGSSLRKEINQEPIDRLEKVVESLQVARDKVQIHLSWGTPWKEIKRVAQHLEADLIALGTVGRGGIKGMIMGNTAEKLLSSCDCSILAVKPDGFVSPIQPVV